MHRLRLQVVVNGRIVCTAGLDRAGTLTAAIKSSLLPKPRRSPFDALFLPPEDEPAESCRLEVSAEPFDFNDEYEYLGWAKEGLNPGDEVVIRVLDAGDADRPTILRAREPPF
jgi:hypothetical protein